MSSKTIDEVTPDTDVTGVEKVPVSDGGTPKSVTVTQVKDFVLAKINALDAATQVDVANDGVFVKKDGAMKPVSAATFCAAVIAEAFGGEATEELAGTDEVVISRSGSVKVTTLAELAAYVKEAVGAGLVNFSDYADESAVAATDYVLVGRVDTETGTWETEKATVGDFCNNVCDAIFNAVEISYAALTDEKDYIYTYNVDDEGNASVRRTRFKESGIGRGDVTKSASTTADGELVVWDGANGKNVKGGITVTDEVTSYSTTKQVPNAAAVYGTVKWKVTAPSTNTDGYIPQWNGENSQTLKDGVALATEQGSTASDAKVLTEKATVAAIAKAITNALATGESPGKITTAISTAITNALATGVSPGEITTAITTAINNALATGTSPGAITKAISTAITNALASGGAISEKISGFVTGPSSTTTGKIPVWGATYKSLRDGMATTDTVTDGSTDAQIPTAAAVHTAVKDVTDEVAEKYVKTDADDETDPVSGNIPAWSGTDKTLTCVGYTVGSSAVAGEGSERILATTSCVKNTVKMTVTMLNNLPSSGSAGYKNGEFIYVTTGSDVGLYLNLGSATSCAWKQILLAQ